VSALILDCVPYFNEADVWRLRYETLRGVVDGFVVVEARQTHSGQPKERTFTKPEDGEDRVYVYGANLPDPGVAGIPATRRREMYQRNAIATVLNLLSFNGTIADDTILLISDCDEIPRPEAVQALRQRGLEDSEVVIFRQSLYYYNLNTCAGPVWNGTRAARWADVRALSPHVIRYGLGQPDEHYPRYLLLQGGGWHLSYFGGPEQVQAKMRAFLHQELVNDENTDPAAIAARINAGEDVWGRPDNAHGLRLGPAEDVPPPVAADPARWAHFFHPQYQPAEVTHGG
jgi:beta-1,4-mannosyl-glycoprotein beta-1,4-N-acetylglucosaminyltransferase